MEYFNKFQIDFIGAEEYVTKYLIHQNMQKNFYSSLGLGKNSFISERHSEFVVRGQIDLVSTFRSSAPAVPKDQDSSSINDKKKSVEDIVGYLATSKDK